jgi:hypothetical protein
MADKKISALTAASTPLAGSEVLPIVQSGSTVKVSVADLTVGRAVTATDFTARKAAGGTLVLDSTAVGTTSNIISTANNGNALADLNYSANTHNWNYGATPLASTDPNGTYKIFTLGTECVRVSINDMTNYKGNYIVGTAGKGIDFSANTHAAGMTSELLNDYEEGTWTPTDGSGAGLTFTGTSGNCFYTKVGNLVTCVFGLVYPTTANTSGAKLAGLPFTSKATTSSVSGGFITYTNSLLTITPLVGTNDTGVNLFLNTGNAAGNNQLSTFILRGIITYMV